MAGEIEERFSEKLRADLLRSGSISFGRFENEDLSWERRSSFAHNRYLEEVEKYSRPGSVTEKKAYFEAHFKKKGMRLPGGFEYPIRREYQSSDNDASAEPEEQDGSVNEGNPDGREDQSSDNDVSVEHVEREDYVNEGSNYAHHDKQNVDCGAYDGYNGGGDFDSMNFDGNHTYYDDSPEGSEYQGQVEWMYHDGEDHHSSAPESLTGTALNTAEVSVEGVHEDGTSLGAHHTETIHEKSSLDNNRQEIDIKGNHICNEGNVGEISVSVDQASKREASEDIKAVASPQQKQSPKKNADMKSLEPRTKPHVNANKVQKSSEVSKAGSKSQNSKAREGVTRKKYEKPSPKSSFSARNSVLKTPRKENSENCSSRTNVVDKRKETWPKRLVESPQSAPKKTETISPHTANRLKQQNGSTKPDTRSGGSKFSFKSDERAERRKEFFLKLEEKMHAKAAVMNQIQAKTQEKAEAEIKRLRKSLNFKATPMPSFYHSTAPADSDEKKLAQSKGKWGKEQEKSSNPGKSTKEREKLFSPGNRSVTKSQQHTKAGSDSPFTKSVMTPNLPEYSEFTKGVNLESALACQAPSNSHPESVVRNQVTCKEREKVKDTNSQKHRPSENGRGSKDHKVESKQKTRTPNARRSMKGVGIGSSSGTGNLAVGVAS